jgi:hypothetical protein
MSLAFMVAVYAAIVATGALAWQIVAFKRSGSRVEVEARIAIYIDGKPTFDLPVSEARDGFTVGEGMEAFLVAVVRNVGRLAVDIESCELDFVDRGARMRPGEQDPPLPYRLEHGQSRILRLSDWRTVSHNAYVGIRGQPTREGRIRVAVKLGNGGVVRSAEQTFLALPMSEQDRA